MISCEDKRCQDDTSCLVLSVIKHTTSEKQCFYFRGAKGYSGDLFVTLAFVALVPYLVVVAIGDGIGVNSSLLHLKQDPHCQHRLAVLSTQLHENPVTHLRR